MNFCFCQTHLFCPFLYLASFEMFQIDCNSLLCVPTACVGSQDWCVLSSLLLPFSPQSLLLGFSWLSCLKHRYGQWPSTGLLYRCWFVANASASGASWLCLVHGWSWSSLRTFRVQPEQLEEETALNSAKVCQYVEMDLRSQMLMLQQMAAKTSRYYNF